MKIPLLMIGATALAGLCHAAPGEPSDANPPVAIADSPNPSDKDPQNPASAGTDAPIAGGPGSESTGPTQPTEAAAKAIPVDLGQPGSEAAKESTQGPTVQVENLQTANGPIDPKTVKVLAPFPAKPLGPVPTGWRLDAANHAPTFTRKVELAEQASVVLKIRPQVLVPDADGSTLFSIQEPGYDPAFGYHQAKTVSHILTNSIRQLDDDSKALGNAIERLEQLLGSLPRPAVPPTVPISNTKLTDKR